MSDDAARRYLRFVLLATTVTAALGAAALTLVGRAAGGGEASGLALWATGGGESAALAGVAVSWAAAVAGGLPLLRAGRAGGGAPAAMIVAALAAMGLRLAVVAGGVVALALAAGLPWTPLLVWAGAGYLALLPVETRYAVAEARAGEVAPERSRAETKEAAPGRRATTTETETR